MLATFQVLNSYMQLCVNVLVTQSCLTLCDPMDCSSPGSSVRGISRAKILESVAFPSPGDLPNPGIKQGSSALQADSLWSEPPGKPLHVAAAAAAAKSLQSCPTPRHPIDRSLPGSSIHGIFQARALEWVATKMDRTEQFHLCRNLYLNSLHEILWELCQI